MEELTPEGTAAAAVQENVGGETGEAGITAEHGAEIITSLGAGLLVDLAAAFHGGEQLPVFHIIRGHPDRGTGVIQRGDPVTEAQIRPGIKRVPVGVVIRYAVQKLHGFRVLSGADHIGGGTQVRINEAVPQIRTGTPRSARYSLTS